MLIIRANITEHWINVLLYQIFHLHYWLNMSNKCITSVLEITADLQLWHEKETICTHMSCVTTEKTYLSHTSLTTKLESTASN